MTWWWWCADLVLWCCSIHLVDNVKNVTSRNGLDSIKAQANIGLALAVWREPFASVTCKKWMRNGWQCWTIFVRVVWLHQPQGGLTSAWQCRAARRELLLAPWNQWQTLHHHWKQEKQWRHQHHLQHCFLVGNKASIQPQTWFTTSTGKPANPVGRHHHLQCHHHHQHRKHCHHNGVQFRSSFRNCATLCQRRRPRSGGGQEMEECHSDITSVGVMKWCKRWSAIQTSGRLEAIIMLALSLEAITCDPDITSVGVMKWCKRWSAIQTSPRWYSMIWAWWNLKSGPLKIWSMMISCWLRRLWNPMGCNCLNQLAVIWLKFTSKTKTLLVKRLPQFSCPAVYKNLMHAAEYWTYCGISPLPCAPTSFQNVVVKMTDFDASCLTPTRVLQQKFEQTFDVLFKRIGFCSFNALEKNKINVTILFVSTCLFLLVCLSCLDVLYWCVIANIGLLWRLVICMKIQRRRF